MDTLSFKTISANKETARKETVDYRYFFNGAKSQVVVAVDSPRVVTLPLVMSKKRIVN